MSEPPLPHLTGQKTTAGLTVFNRWGSPRTALAMTIFFGICFVIQLVMLCILVFFAPRYTSRVGWKIAGLSGFSGVMLVRCISSFRQWQRLRETATAP